MILIDPSTFDRDGALTIGIGAKHCLYTLRQEYNEQGKVSVGDGLPPEIRTFRRSNHVRNLGKDWAEVAGRLPSILTEMGYPDDTAIYVPGHANGILDPNKAPDPKFIPTEIIPFGQYQDSTIGEILTKDPDYLFYLAESYHPNEERARGRWMAFLRSELSPQLETRRAEREVKEQAAEVVRASNRKRTAPLADLLRSNSRQPGDFSDSMAKHFETGQALEDLQDRAYNIVKEIYGKHVGGRRGSKAYQAAESEFDQKFSAPPPEPSVTPKPIGIVVTPSDKFEGFLEVNYSDPSGGTAYAAIQPVRDIMGDPTAEKELALIHWGAAPGKVSAEEAASYKGKGFGRRALKALFTEAQKRGVSNFTVFSPTEDTRQVIKHYFDTGLLGARGDFDERGLPSQFTINFDQIPRLDAVPGQPPAATPRIQMIEAMERNATHLQQIAGRVGQELGWVPEVATSQISIG